MAVSAVVLTPDMLRNWTGPDRIKHWPTQTANYRSAIWAYGCLMHTSADQPQYSHNLGVKLAALQSVGLDVGDDHANIRRIYRRITNNRLQSGQFETENVLG